MFKNKWGAGVFCLGLMLSAALMAPDASAAEPSPRLVETTAATLTLNDLSARDPRLQRTLGALRAEAAAKGSVLVAVKLPVAFAPETMLSEAEKLQQRRDIDAAVRALRSSLPQAKSFEPVPDLPYVRLGLDTAGLARLERLPGLARVTRAEAMNWPRDFTRLFQASARAGLGMAPHTPPEELFEVSEQIVGGQVAAPGTHPFQVALLYKGVPNDYEAKFCGGTLVAERYIVTAAHCSGFYPEIVQVLVGARRLDGSGRRINVSEIRLHPSYRFWLPITNDIAVWKLETPVVDIPFAKLANTQPTMPGTPLMSTGWGWNDLSTSTRPMDLQQFTAPFVPCDGAFICTGVVAGRSVCFGDSGGPLTIDRGDGYTELVGVTSWVSSANCAASELNGFTNVAHSSTRTFLYSILPHDSFVPRVRYTGRFGFQVPRYIVNRSRGVINIPVKRPSRAGQLTLTVTIAKDIQPSNRDLWFDIDTSGRETLVFEPGSDTAILSLPIVDDDWMTLPDQYFVLSIENAPPGFRSTSRLIISDDGRLPGRPDSVRVSQ